MMILLVKFKLGAADSHTFSASKDNPTLFSIKLIENAIQSTVKFRHKRNRRDSSLNTVV